MVKDFNLKTTTIKIGRKGMESSITSNSVSKTGVPFSTIARSVYLCLCILYLPVLENTKIETGGTTTVCCMQFNHHLHDQYHCRFVNNLCNKAHCTQASI